MPPPRASLGLTALLAGCAADATALPEVAWEGERLRFRTDSDVAVCGRSLEHLDEFVALIESTLEVTLDDKVDYVFHPEAFVDLPCAEEAAGCALGTTAYSRFVPHEHEIVHVVTSAWGRTDRAFMEGLAVLYGDDVPGPELAELPTHAPDEMIGTADMLLPAEMYTSAGHMMAFLRERHELAELQRFWMDVPIDATADEVTAGFAAAFDEPWQDFVAAHAAAPSCARGALRAKLVECAAPTVPWSAGAWEYRVELDCDMDDVLGSENFLLHTIATVEIATGGPYLLQPLGDGDDVIVVARCSGCAEGFVEQLYSASGPRIFELAAGRYYVKPHRFGGDPGATGLRIEPQ